MKPKAKKDKHTMLIDLPPKVKSILEKRAVLDNRKLKPYVEKVLIDHCSDVVNKLNR